MKELSPYKSTAQATFTQSDDTIAMGSTVTD